MRSPGRTSTISPDATAPIGSLDRLAIAAHARRLGLEADQALDRFRGAALGARLEQRPSRIRVTMTAAASK
jgi:hypothetical protein